MKKYPDPLNSEESHQAVQWMESNPDDTLAEAYQLTLNMCAAFNRDDKGFPNKVGNMLCAALLTVPKFDYRVFERCADIAFYGRDAIGRTILGLSE